MPLVIDADGHVEETLPELVVAIPPAMRDNAIQLVAEANGYVTYRIEGRLWRSAYPFPGGLANHVSAGGKRREGGRDPKVRLQVLDDEGIDAAVLYPSVGLMFGLLGNPDVAAALCAAYNDWLAGYCAADARRLIGVALLPQQDPGLAAAELERSVTVHGFVGGVMRPNRIGGRTAAHPDFDVLWGKAQQLDVPVSLHEAYLSGVDTIGVDRMSGYAGCHIVSHVFEQMAAMVTVTLAGIFHRFPGLRLGFLEAGCGWAPTWVDRIEEHYELAPGDYRWETRAEPCARIRGSPSRSRSQAWSRHSSRGGPTTSCSPPTIPITTPSIRARSSASRNAGCRLDWNETCSAPTR